MTLFAQAVLDRQACGRPNCVCQKSRTAGKGLTHCVAHADAEASMNVTPKAAGAPLLHCHAGCSQDAVFAAYCELDVDRRPAAISTPLVRTEYVITDAAGQYVATKVRTDGPDGKKMSWREPLPAGVGTADLLFGVEDLMSADIARAVFICEGEKAARSLRKRGVLAVGTVGGANSTPSEDTLRPLVGRRVALWPDNDEPGRNHMLSISAVLRGLGVKPLIVEWPEAPEKGDAADWRGVKDDLPGMVRPFPEPVSSNGHVHPLSKQTENSKHDAEDEDEKRSQASIMVDLALAAGWDLWADERDDPWASIPVGEHSENWPLDGDRIERLLGRTFWNAKHKVAGAQAVKDASRTLAGHALYEGGTAKTYVRIAGVNGAIYHDLGDDAWRAVKITAAGWEVVADAPVKFRRPASSQSIPAPEAGGSLADLTDLINIVDEDDRRLVVAFLVGAMRDTGPYPLLHLQGQQGTAKTMTARLIKRVVDPTVGDMRKAPEKTDDLVVGARSSWLMAFDNLSGLTHDLSDDLCRLATGGGMSKRAHYTNEEEHVIDVMRPCVLTGIDDLASRGDLASRSIFVSLPVIEDGQRLTEREVNARFDAALPKILGALYDAVACALAHVDITQVDNLPRLADFGLWVTAAEGALGWDAGSFLAAYARNAHEATQVTLEASPIAEFLRELSWTKPDGWHGSPADLLASVNELSEKKEPGSTRSKYWPKTPRGIRNAVDRVAPALREQGCYMVAARSHGSRRISLKRGETGAAGAATGAATPRIGQAPGGVLAGAATGRVYPFVQHKGKETEGGRYMETGQLPYVDVSDVAAPAAPVNTPRGAEAVHGSTGTRQAPAAPDACPRCASTIWFWKRGHRICRACFRRSRPDEITTPTHKGDAH